MAMKSWLVFVTTLIGLFQMNDQARACSCVGPSGLDILPSNAAVYTGRVVSIEYLEPDTKSSEPPIRVTFDVSEVWKGPLRNTMILDTIYNKYSCSGYFFKTGQRYLVAATTITRDKGKSDVADVEGVFLCGGTSTLSGAAENIEALGDGDRPE